MNITCPNCQTENLTTAKFCKKCGSSLIVAQSANPILNKELSDIEKRVSEEKLYEQVAMDLKNGSRKEGLYAKALVDANGSAELANAFYIKHAVQSLQDELMLEAEQERALYQQKNKPEEPPSEQEMTQKEIDTIRANTKGVNELSGTVFYILTKEKSIENNQVKNISPKIKATIIYDGFTFLSNFIVRRNGTYDDFRLMYNTEFQIYMLIQGEVISRWYKEPRAGSVR